MLLFVLRTALSRRMRSRRCHLSLVFARMNTQDSSSVLNGSLPSVPRTVVTGQGPLGWYRAGGFL